MKSFCLFLIFFIANSQAVPGNRMSDREHDGFVGPVKKVSVDWSPVSLSREYVALGSHCRQMANSYDESGRLIQHSVYAGSCGDDEFRELYSYFADGCRTTKAEEIRGKNSPPPPPPMIGPKSNAKDEVGEPHMSFKYAPSGQLIEEALVNPSGTVVYKYTFSYDTQNRMVELTGYDDKGKLSDRRVYGYVEDKRPPSEFAYYGSDGKKYEQTTYSEYKFNSHGDWIKRQVKTEETLNRQSIAIESRKIEYYPAK